MRTYINFNTLNTNIDTALYLVNTPASPFHIHHMLIPALFSLGCCVGNRELEGRKKTNSGTHATAAVRLPRVLAQPILVRVYVFLCMGIHISICIDNRHRYVYLRVCLGRYVTGKHIPNHKKKSPPRQQRNSLHHRRHRDRTVLIQSLQQQEERWNG